MIVLGLIDRLKIVTISDSMDGLYNKVIEKFLIYKGKTQINQSLPIIDHLINKKVKLNYYN